MTSGEFSPTRDSIIRGKHVDIILQSGPELSDYLQESHGPETLYHMPSETLHYPITHASLDFYKNEPDDLSLFANTTFDALAVNGPNIRNWQNKLSTLLKDSMIAQELEVYDLPHQQHDFYIKMNDTIAARIQFSADTHECSVLLSTENLSELSYASEGKYTFEPDPDSSQTSEHIDVLRDFASMWSLAIDTITDKLGSADMENLPRPQIVLAPPADAHADIDESKQIVVWKNPTPQLDMPEIELYSSPENGFMSIGGLTDAKQRLADIADLFTDQVASYMYGLSPQHFILHGPPGTGKTSLVKAFAYEIGGTLEQVKSSDIISKYVGESAQNLEAMFTKLYERPGNERIVLFFDEFEALGMSGKAGTQERVDVKKLLNQAIDNITANHKNIIIAAATNSDIDDLEPSLVRPGRIEPIGAGNPNELERADIWATVLTQSIVSFGGAEGIEFHAASESSINEFIPYDVDINPIDLAHHSEGLNGSHFEVLLIRARMKKFRHYKRTGELTIVTHDDVLAEIAQYGR
jgi:predicted AAA+ superfamily ATPase